MRMHRHVRQSTLRLEQVEEHERLHHLAEIRRAHQPGDRPVLAAARAVNDFAVRESVGRSHFERRASRLRPPPPNAATCSSPPAIATFLKKWIIWFWSERAEWKTRAVTIANRASTVAAARVR